VRLRYWFVAAMIAVLAWPGVAAAAPFNVTTTADGAPDGECVIDCTLREAVTLAGNSDQVNVPAGNYVLTVGELFLTSDHIVGAGARTTFIDGGNASRVMFVSDGTTTISGVTIRRGNGVANFANGFGGGIFVQSGTTLQLTNSAVSGNSAEGGGGIATSGTVFLFGSTVSGNTAATGRLTRGGGISASSTGALGLANSTVSGNTAKDTGVVDNSEGGGIYSAGQLALIASTIANNSAADGGGIHVVAPQAGTFSLSNSIVSATAGGACAGSGLGALTATFNLANDGSCQFKDPSNRQDVSLQLGPLANNGGQTNTHALLPASPAINFAGSCTATDQRDVVRPQPAGGRCDSGAYEYRAPQLKVVMAVINDAGGTRLPSGFTVHVRNGAVDVKGSPQAGDLNGTTHTLDAGSTYTVAADNVPGYTLAVSGDCAAADGSITLQEGQNRTCTITANDIAPTLRVATAVVNDNGGARAPGDFMVHVRAGGNDVSTSPQAGTAAGTVYTLSAGIAYTVAADAVTGYTSAISGDCAGDGSITLGIGQSRTCTITANDDAPPVRAQNTTQELPPPVVGEKVNALPKSGTVKIKLPGTNTFVDLKEGQQIPVGTVIDVRNGRITLIAAADRSGGTATADFYGGIFELGQTKGAAPITTAELVEKLSCAKGGKASIAATRKKKRRLWGDGSGKFRTDGEFSSATVRGTKWLVQDNCDSTLTKVVRGKVAVRDKVKRKTVIVRAGKQYIARAKR
jgi:hypothetical protein